MDPPSGAIYCSIADSSTFAASSTAVFSEPTDSISFSGSSVVGYSALTLSYKTNSLEIYFSESGPSGTDSSRIDSSTTIFSTLAVSLALSFPFYIGSSWLTDLRPSDSAVSTVTSLSSLEAGLITSS